MLENPLPLRPNTRVDRAPWGLSLVNRYQRVLISPPSIKKSDTGDVRGAIAGKKYNQVGDFLGLGKAPGRGLAGLLFRHLGGIPSLSFSDRFGDAVAAEPEVSRNRAGTHRVDADAAWSNSCDRALERLPRAALAAL